MSTSSTVSLGPINHNSVFPPVAIITFGPNFSQILILFHSEIRGTQLPAVLKLPPYQIKLIYNISLCLSFTIGRLSPICSLHQTYLYLQPCPLSFTNYTQYYGYFIDQPQHHSHVGIFNWFYEILHDHFISLVKGFQYELSHCESVDTPLV